MILHKIIALISVSLMASPVLARPTLRKFRLSPEDRQILKDGQMSTTRYVVSGVLGTYPGFGIGHAIQGRWLEKGWIFTSGEIVTGFIGLAITFGCHEPTSTSPSGHNCGTADAFIAAYVALKVWEAVDVWYEPYAHDRRYRELRRQLRRAPRLRGLVTPTRRGVLLALQYQFD